VIALIPDSALVTLNSAEIFAIIYLAIAISKLRADVSRLEGKNEQRERDADRKDDR